MTIVRPATRDLRVLLLLIAVAVGARAITFGNPIVHVDEEFYFTAARAWLNGAMPYVGVWDRKPPGLFALYLAPAALGYPAGIWAYQAMALAAVVASAWLAVLLARCAGWHRAAPFAGVAYLLWLDLAEGQGGQAPVFYTLMVALAARLLIGERAARRRSGVAAMALIGIAMTIKTSVVFEGVFFGLWAMARRRRSGASSAATLGYGAAMVAVAALPSAAWAIGYAAIGQFDAWSYANVTSIFQRRGEGLAKALGNLAVLLLILSPLLGVAAVAWHRHRARSTAEQAFLFGWLAVAFGAVLAFGSWFDHYALPVMLPAAVCAAGAVPRDAARRWPVIALIVVALGGQALLLSKRVGRGTPAQFAALVRVVDAAPPGCLYVYTGSTMLYTATGRCRVTRWIFASHLSRDREQGAIGGDQATEVRRILAARPAVIVMRGPYRGERVAIRALVTRALGDGYARRAVVPLGRDRVAVFASTRP